MSVTSSPAAVASAAKAKDWTYLLAKAPSDLHVDLSQFIAEELGTDLAELDPTKLVQAVLAMHGTWQKTDRVARRRRTEESIAKGGATTAVRRGYEVVGADAPAPAPVEEAAPAPAPKPRRRAAASKPKAPAAK